MTCKHLNDNLDDFIDNALSEVDMAEASKHIVTCDDCQTLVSEARALQALLKEYGYTDVATPTAEFFDQTLIRAAHRGGRQQRKQSWLKGFGSAIAVGVAVWVVSGLFFSTPEFPESNIPSVTMALEEPRTVNLVFASTSDIVDATLTVILPEGIEIDGFDGQQEISWVTSLTAGRNVLPLKLIATSPHGGEILATLQHNQDDRTFRLRVTVI